MSSFYRPRCAIELHVPRNSTTRTTDVVTLSPLVVSARWKKNSITKPDELDVTLDFRTCGFDVRFLRNGRCRFWVWDEVLGPLDTSKHLRFTGILEEPERMLGEDASSVTLKFRDWTVLLMTPNFPADGVPEWSDSLATAWSKICDHVGYLDIDEGKIVSSVEALKDAIVFSDRSLKDVTLGELVPERFHAIGKPAWRAGESGWALWQQLTQGLGLVSYVDRDTVVVSRVLDHFAEGNAPAFYFGHNIIKLTEKSLSPRVGRGVLLRSFDPLRGITLEAVFPPPGDPRVKHPRIHAATGKSKSAVVKDLVGDYLEFNYHQVTEQGALDTAAQSVWEQMRRQEVEGSLTTREMVVDGIDILALAPGDTILVDVDPLTRLGYAALGDGGASTRIAYLVSRGYTEETAQLIEQNMTAFDAGIYAPLWHVKEFEMQIGDDKFEIEVHYQNRIYIQGDNPNGASGASTPNERIG